MFSLNLHSNFYFEDTVPYQEVHIIFKDGYRLFLRYSDVDVEFKYQFILVDAQGHLTSNKENAAFRFVQAIYYSNSSERKRTENYNEAIAQYIIHYAIEHAKGETVDRDNFHQIVSIEFHTLEGMDASLEVCFNEGYLIMQFDFVKAYDKGLAKDTLLQFYKSNPYLHKGEFTQTELQKTARIVNGYETVLFEYIVYSVSDLVAEAEHALLTCRICDCDIDTLTAFIDKAKVSETVYACDCLYAADILWQYLM